MLARSKGQGRPLPREVQAEMEAHLEADLSRVRIHTGEDAVHMTRQLRAMAFTQGCNIYFNEGQYQPHTEAGKKLLAHELTHVVQQKGKG